MDDVIINTIVIFLPTLCSNNCKDILNLLRLCIHMCTIKGCNDPKCVLDHGKHNRFTCLHPRCKLLIAAATICNFDWATIPEDKCCELSFTKSCGEFYNELHNCIHPCPTEECFDNKCIYDHMPHNPSLCGHLRCKIALAGQMIYWYNYFNNLNWYNNYNNPKYNKLTREIKYTDIIISDNVISNNVTDNIISDNTTEESSIKNKERTKINSDEICPRHEKGCKNFKNPFRLCNHPCRNKAECPLPFCLYDHPCINKYLCVHIRCKPNYPKECTYYNCADAKDVNRLCIHSCLFQKICKNKLCVFDHLCNDPFNCHHLRCKLKLPIEKCGIQNCENENNIYGICVHSCTKEYKCRDMKCLKNHNCIDKLNCMHIKCKVQFAKNTDNSDLQIKILNKFIVNPVNFESEENKPCDKNPCEDFHNTSRSCKHYCSNVYNCKRNTCKLNHLCIDPEKCGHIMCKK